MPHTAHTATHGNTLPTFTCHMTNYDMVAATHNNVRERHPLATSCCACSNTATHSCGNTATHCNALQRTATHCNTLQRTATHCNPPQPTATPYHTLQHTATHCNTLQHTATPYHTLQLTTVYTKQKSSALTPAEAEAEKARVEAHLEGPVARARSLVSRATGL